MKILIVAATQAEIQPTIDYIHQHHLTDEFHILITGVGATATVYSLTKTLSQHSFDWVFNLGIAGTFSHDIALGQALIIDKDCFADLGADDHGTFIPLHALGFSSPNDKPYSDGFIVNKQNPSLACLQSIRTVSGLTVNTTSGSVARIQTLEKLFPVVVETMEGAGFMYCCEMENVSYSQIRTISNRVEPRNKANWNIPLAIERLNQLAINMIQELISHGK